MTGRFVVCPTEREYGRGLRRKSGGEPPRSKWAGLKTGRYTSRTLRGDGVVAFEGFANIVGRKGTFAPDTPVVTPEFDDGGRHFVGGIASVEDEGKTITELREDFGAAGAGGRAGKIGTGAGERDAEFGDEIDDDFGFGPAERDAAGVSGDLEWQAV